MLHGSPGRDQRLSRNGVTHRRRVRAGSLCSGNARKRFVHNRSGSRRCVRVDSLLNAAVGGGCRSGGTGHRGRVGGESSTHPFSGRHDLRTSGIHAEFGSNMMQEGLAGRHGEAIVGHVFNNVEDGCHCYRAVVERDEVHVTYGQLNEVP